MPELLRLAWPIALSTVSYSAMTLVDTVFIGRVGRAELAGVALGGLAAFVLIGFALGLLRGAGMLAAQAVGGGRAHEVPALRAAALATAVGFGVLAILGGQLVARWVLPQLTATEAAGRAAATYLSVRVLGAPFALCFAALREVRYGQGDPRTPMRASVVANLTNIVLASILVFGLHQGVAGAALATVFAHVLELALLAHGHRWQAGPVLARPRRQQLLALWRIGVPTGLQFMLELGAFALLSLFVARRSEAEMAAHQIAAQVLHFAFLPAVATAEAAALLAARAVGAHEDGLVLRVSRTAGGVSAAYAGLCALLFAGGASVLARAFTPDATVARIAVRLLYVAAAFQVFDALNVVARNVLRGTGDTRFAAMVGVSTAWLATPPLAWGLGQRLGMGVVGGWLGLALQIVLSSSILIARVERRGWAAAAARVRAHHRAAVANPSPGAIQTIALTRARPEPRGKATWR